MHQSGPGEEQLLRAEAFCSSQMVKEILLRSDDFGKSWTVDQIEKLRPCGRSLDSQCMMTTGSDPKLIIDCDIQADKVDAIQLEAKNIGPEVELFWAGARQAFSPKRMVKARVSLDRTSAIFPLTEELEWVGKIKKIRIDPCSASGRSLGIHELRLIQYTADQKQIDEAVGKLWSVQLGDESRTAMIGQPGKTQRWQVDVLPGDQLDTAFGVLPGAKTSVKFVIKKAGTPAGSQPIFSKLVRPESPQAHVWNQVSVPLGCQHKQKLTLEFRAICPSTDNPIRGLPVWASPTLRRISDENQKPNIVLISIDTVRADHMSAYSYSRNTSPNIDAWAKDKGIAFDNAVVAAPWTLPSHVSMLSGVEAMRHGINYGIPDHSFPLMSQVFARHGYETIAFTGGGFLNPSFGFEPGFDAYHAWPSSADSAGELESNTEGFVNWLQKHRDNRFFAFFHTYEVHSPFRPREPYFGSWCEPQSSSFKGLVVLNDAGLDRSDGYTALKHFDLHAPGKAIRPLRKDEMQLATDLYDAGIAYADKQIGRILKTLESTGLAADTVVVITSDHGEGLGDRGLAGHAYPYDFNVMVPLIISIPGLTPPNSRISNQVRSVDIAPTLLDISGFEADVKLDGVSLLPFFRGEDANVPKEAWIYAAKTNYGIGLRLDNTTKFIWNNTAWSPAQSREELYDLGSDPGEEKNLAAHGADLDHLRKTVLSYLQENERGLRIRCVNPSSHESKGRFEFDRKQDLIVAKVKGLEFSPEVFQVISAKAVGFTILSGEDCTVYFEDLRTKTLRIVMSPSSKHPRPLDLTIDLPIEQTTFIAQALSGEWQRSAHQPESGRPFFAVEWKETEGRQLHDEKGINPELEDQLRALGYLQ